MHIPIHSVTYIAPQSEIIEVQIEHNFMGSGDPDKKSFRASFSFEEGGVGDGGDL